MPLEHGLPTGPLASRLGGAGGGPVDNPAAYHMHTHFSLPPFRLIPELELTQTSPRFASIRTSTFMPNLTATR